MSSASRSGSLTESGQPDLLHPCKWLGKHTGAAELRRSAIDTSHYLAVLGRSDQGTAGMNIPVREDPTSELR